MLAVLVASSLTVDESGVRFPIAAVCVVGATAALAVLVMRRTSSFVLAVSEGFLWTIALASARALYTPARWMTFVCVFSSVGVGTVMAYLHAATVRDRFVRSTMRIFATLGAVAIAASTVVAARTRSIVDGDLSFLQQVPVERWSSSSTTNCAAIEARGKCAFVVEHACVEGGVPVNAEGLCTNWEQGCLATCQAVGMEAWRLPDGPVIAALTMPSLWGGRARERHAPSVIEGGRLSPWPVRYVRLGKPPPLPSSWLWAAGDGLVAAVAAAIVWGVRCLLPRLRRSKPASVPAEGPYRHTKGLLPEAPHEPPSPVWRYARLLTLAAMLPAAVWTVARMGLALFP